MERNILIIKDYNLIHFFYFSELYKLSAKAIPKKNDMTATVVYHHK